MIDATDTTISKGETSRNRFTPYLSSPLPPSLIRFSRSVIPQHTLSFVDHPVLNVQGGFSHCTDGPSHVTLLIHTHR